MSAPDDWMEWLADSSGAVRAVARETDGPREMIRSVPAALAEADLARFVWVTSLRPDTDTVRVRAASGPHSPPTTLPATEQAPTVRALAEDAVVCAPASDRPDSDPGFTESLGVPSETGAIHVPFQALGAGGAVHLSTDRDVTDAAVPAAASVLGTVLEDCLSVLGTETALSRERDRLETVRSTLSHDMGNPLNLASGRLELADEECDSPHLSHALSGLRAIDSMRTASVSFVQAGKPAKERERRSVDATVEETWTELSTGERTLVTEPVTARGEPDRLRHLLSELLDNALVHTANGVDVSVGPLPGGRGFYLADSGTGIPADERDLVFDRGYTTDPDRDGHGLTLVREIAGAHGWQVRLAETDTGTRVEVVTDRW